MKTTYSETVAAVYIYIYIYIKNTINVTEVSSKVLGSSFYASKINILKGKYEVSYV